MKLQQKKRIAQKLWGWICLSINCLVITVFLASMDPKFLSGGILLSGAILCYGAVKTLSDKTKGDLSGASVAIVYICVYMITLLAAFRASAALSSTTLLITLAICAVIQWLVFLLITYWHAIRRFFQRRSCL